MPGRWCGRDSQADMAAKPRGLIDTGAILALLDRKDPWHAACAEAFRELALPLATSAAVLTEVFHLFDRPHELSKAWGFLTSDAVTVLPIGDEDLPDLETLM